jgi:hypothetical protein
VKLTSIAVVVLSFSLGAPTYAAALTDLVGGATLSEGDIIFSNFKFDDRFGTDVTGGLLDRQNAPFSGDRSVSASEIEVTTSSIANTVTLAATISPAISISDEFSPGFDHIFDFFLDFTVSVLSTSTREITGVTLGGGDLFATGEAVSEVIYDILGYGGGNDLAIFEAPLLNPSSSTSDSESFAAMTSLLFEGQIEGNTSSGATAGLSTFSLTFNLQGTPPPDDQTVPTPATIALLSVGLAGLSFRRRRLARTAGHWFPQPWHSRFKSPYQR